MAWFFTSLFLGKRGRENQQLLKKHMLISTEAPNGEKYLEINKERGAVLATKNYQGGLDDKKDESNRKFFWKTRLKTLPSESHREIPVTCESQMQQYSRNREANAKCLTQQRILCRTARVHLATTRLKICYVRYDFKSWNKATYNKPLDQSDHRDGFVSCKHRESVHQGNNRPPKWRKHQELLWYADIRAV